MTVRQLGHNLLIETVRSDESGQSLDRLVNFEYTLEVLASLKAAFRSDCGSATCAATICGDASKLIVINNL